MSAAAPLQAASDRSKRLSLSIGGGLLQRKLVIGALSDPLEKEADRVAEEVMAMPDHSELNNTPPIIQGFTGQPIGSSEEAPASVDRVLANAGRPLEPDLRHDMEQRFGHDFSLVRVHTDPTAVQSARKLNAEAYTVGRSIVFAEGQYTPKSNRGRRLIAHELTHVVQQQAANGPIPDKFGISLSSCATSVALQRQEQTQTQTDNQAIHSVIDSARRCSDLDNKVMIWAYNKAEPLIFSRFRGLNYSPAIYGRTTWKKPSEWGELDMDILYGMVKEGASGLEGVEQIKEGKKAHAKIIAHFELASFDRRTLLVRALLITWYDGRAVTIGEWEGILNIAWQSAFFEIPPCETRIKDVAQPKRQPILPRQRLRPKKNEAEIPV